MLAAAAGDAPLPLPLLPPPLLPLPLHAAAAAPPPPTLPFCLAAASAAAQGCGLVCADEQQDGGRPEEDPGGGALPCGDLEGGGHEHGARPVPVRIRWVRGGAARWALGACWVLDNKRLDGGRTRRNLPALPAAPPLPSPALPAEEINKRPDEYWTLVMDIARKNNLKRVLRCTQIMGRSENDDLSAAQIFYPIMQAADIFFLKVGGRQRRGARCAGACWLQWVGACCCWRVQRSGRVQRSAAPVCGGPAGRADAVLGLAWPGLVPASLPQRRRTSASWPWD